MRCYPRFFIDGCSDVPLSLHSLMFMNEVMRIDETLPPSLRTFCFITIIGIMFGSLFFSLLCSYKAQKKRQLKEFDQRETDIFM